MSLRLACLGAATARSAAPRACAAGSTRLVSLSSPAVALLLLFARLWLPMSTASLLVATRQLAMDINLDACELLPPQSPVQWVAGRPLMLNDSQFSRLGLLHSYNNDTAAAGKNGMPNSSLRLHNGGYNHLLFGVDSLLVIPENVSAEVAHGLDRFRGGVVQYMWVELCNSQHLLVGHPFAVGSSSTSSTSEFLLMNLLFAILGSLFARVSSKSTRFEVVLKLYNMVKFKSAYNACMCACSFYLGVAISTSTSSFQDVVSSFNVFTNKGLLGSNSSTSVIMLLILLNLPSTAAVCSTCKGAVDGCAGGAACPWLTTVASNAAAVVITATAGFISAKALLPPGLLQAFPRSVLDTILLLARMPAARTPFNMTSTTTAAELRMAYRQGRISKSDVAEGISTLVSNAGSTSEELTKLQMQIKALELELSEAEPQARTELGGVYVYVLAKISQFVLKSNAPVWARAIQERTGTSMAASLHFPPAEIADGAVPMMAQLFVLFVHAFGLEHLHTVGPFIHRVVHESVWVNDFTWQYAFELLVIYLKALDERRNTISMGTIWESGSQDTFIKNAQKAAIQRWGTKFVFFRAHGGNPGTDAAGRAAATAAAAVAAADATAKGGANKAKWNGKWTPGAKPCLTFNNGRDQHPRNCLLADGTCKFDHVCDHFVTGGGKCGSSAHGRTSCDNPSKLPRQQ